ncbi:hypothetical protein K7G98_34255, partial [Saccharothrix sp. MB29]|nr:hypothetical protein [Saccharothrix sp. MB29]
SYSAAGSDLSSRLALASAFAAPTQHSSVASWRPWYTANARPSALTGPPSRTPRAQSGSGTSGSVSSTATDVFVPAHRVADAEKAVLGTLDDRSNTGATGRDYCLYPLVLAESLAAFVGMARGAYELFTGRLNGRGISYSSWTDQSAHPLTHVQVATAANKITAAEAMLDRMVGVIQRRA